VATLKQKWCSRRAGNHVEAWEYKYVRRKHIGGQRFSFTKRLGAKHFQIRKHWGVDVF